METNKKSFLLPVDLMKEFKIHCVHLNTNQSQLLIKLIQKELSNND